jgi:anti-sigma-K factor RskA
MPKKRSWVRVSLWRYGNAVLAVAAAVLVLLAPLIQTETPFLLIITLILSAWLGSWGPGLLATGLVVVVALLIALVASTGAATGPGKGNGQALATYVFRETVAEVTEDGSSISVHVTKGERTGRDAAAGHPAADGAPRNAGDQGRGARPVEGGQVFYLPQDLCRDGIEGDVVSRRKAIRTPPNG